MSAIYNELRRAYKDQNNLMLAITEALTEEERIHPATGRVAVSRVGGSLADLSIPLLHKLLEFAPTFYANRDAEATAETARIAEQDADPAAKKLAELEELIGDGYQVSATALAEARAAAAAEADIKVLAEDGRKKREAAAKAAAKRRAEGIAAAAQALPQRPEGLDDAIDAAKDAIRVVRTLCGEHTEGLCQVNEILLAAGIEEHPQKTGKSATDIMDWENHGHGNSTVTVNGVLHRPIAGRIMGELARFAAPGIDDASLKHGYR